MSDDCEDAICDSCGGTARLWCDTCGELLCATHAADTRHAGHDVASLEAEFAATDPELAAAATRRATRDTEIDLFAASDSDPPRDAHARMSNSEGAQQGGAAPLAVEEERFHDVLSMLELSPSAVAAGLVISADEPTGHFGDVLARSALAREGNEWSLKVSGFFAQLRKRCFVVVDDFVTPAVAAAARVEMMSLGARKELDDARVGQRGDVDLEEVDGDAGGARTTALACIAKQLAAFGVALGSGVRLAATSQSNANDLALWKFLPTTTRRPQQRDALPSDGRILIKGARGRRLSCVLMLASSADAAAAPLWRLHGVPGATEPVDVANAAGRLVVFLSGALTTEVLPSDVEEFCIAQWW